MAKDEKERSWTWYLSRAEDASRKGDTYRGMHAKPEEALKAGWAEPLRARRWMEQLAVEILWFARNNDPFVSDDWPYKKFEAKLSDKGLTLPEEVSIQQAVAEVIGLLRQVGNRKARDRGRDKSIPADATWYELNVGIPLLQKRTRLDVGADAIDAPYPEGVGSQGAFEAPITGANYYDTLDTSKPERRVVLYTDLERLRVLAGNKYDGARRALQATGLSAGQTKKLSREHDTWATVGELCALILNETGGESQQIDDVLSAFSYPDAAQMTAGELSLKANPLLCEAVQKAAPERLDDVAFYGEVGALLLRQVTGEWDDLERLEVLAGNKCDGAGRALQATGLSAGQTKKLSREYDTWATVGELCALILNETGGESQQIDDVLSAFSDSDAALKADPLLCEAVRKVAPERLDDVVFYGEVGALLLEHVTTGVGESHVDSVSSALPRTASPPT